ncbi:hypothetical protein N7450_005563 [Penicillium hetheringtonii]|uniref:Uncharacterized protein n=1 Tax=Penicillium hetheringtonii TaxID=911720 RepID=A0AAD6DIK4_9EURO|nr:hypothetical protein N7450_005563 [Penicillium hetheringtonii]
MSPAIKTEKMHFTNGTGKNTALLRAHRLSYDELPNKKQVWNTPPNSEEEGLGRLIILTPDIVQAAAASCIQTGRRVCLNWDMNKLETANFSRQPAQHHIVPLMNGVAFDDIYIFNPQQSSQWDGLRHFSAPSSSSDNPSRRVFYGGVDAEEIMDRRSTRIGLQHWAKEGICGRGVLLDYGAYASKKRIQFSSFSSHSIPLSVLKEISQEQKVTFKFGDILFVRIGLVREWDTQMDPIAKAAYASSSAPLHAGVEGTEEMLRWIWDSGFAAVASDSVSFEVFPPKESYPRDGGAANVEGVFMHEVLLPGWGMPIGELFDLEGLSELCKAEGRWEFFVASAPLNMPGGASSPPNCVAIF